MGVFYMKIRTKRNIIKIKYIVVQGIQIIVGTAFIAIAIALFLLPNQLSSGGFAGIGTILYYLFGISLGTTTIVLNIPLFIVSLIKNGKSFFINAIAGTIFLSIFLNIFEKLNPLTTDRFLACIYGGVIAGIGTAIVLKANASTGGTDLVANIAKSFKPDIKVSSLIVILDTIIVGLNVLFFKEIEIGLYSAITIYLMGKILDIFFEGVNFSKMLLIISPKYEQISERISKEIRRGVTSLYGKGMYKRENKNILMCIASRREVRDIRKIIREIDKNAFVIISNAREVFGEGFKRT